MGMKSACVRALWGFGVPAGLRVGALIMHDTARDTDSLSDWDGQGDPVVTVDWRGRDEASLRPGLPPQKKKPPPHLLTLPSTPQGKALGASRPRISAASWGGGPESELFHLLCSFLLEIHGLVPPLCFLYCDYIPPICAAVTWGQREVTLLTHNLCVVSSPQDRFVHRLKICWLIYCCITEMPFHSL